VFLHYPVYNENGEIENNPDNWIYSKEVSAKEIWEQIMQRAYDNGEPGIFFYDNLNKDNNLWYVENIVCSNPCAEYLAGTIYGVDNNGNKLNPNDFGGACNLGSLFLHNFVDKPFTKSAKIDHDKLKEAIFVAVKMLDNIIDINNFPDKIYENYQKSFRTIGLGITGLADMLAMLGVKYNSMEARIISDDLMNFIALNTYKASIELAKEKGEFPLLNREKFVESGFITKHCKRSDEWIEVKNDILKYGIRNAKMLSVAPTGTLSLTFGNNCSSGLEPIFSLEYERKVKVGGQAEENARIVPMRDYAYGEWLKVKDSTDCVVDKNVFITALEMTVDEHVDMLSTIAYHIDMSCSKTINVPSDYSFEDTKKIYEKCHELGIKGCTIFRPNEIRKGILISKNESEKGNNVNTNTFNELPRGYIIDVSDDLVGYKRKLNTGCGSIHFEVYSDEITGEPQETFINIGSSGGCERNYQFISRLMSLALRAGVSIESIIDQAMSIRPCNAYVNRTKTKKDTSTGTSCPSAIGYALKDLHDKMQDMYVPDLDCDLEECNICVSNVEKQISNSNEKCPECGEELSFEGGCNLCKSCGWSKCN
jgi:ribonucleoside-diphosphate reductase alpha chain